MCAGKDSGARDDPKLLQHDSSQNDTDLGQNIVRQTQSEERKYPFIVDIKRGSPGVPGVQPVTGHRHLQRQSQKALVNPQRQQ